MPGLGDGFVESGVPVVSCRNGRLPFITLKFSLPRLSASDDPIEMQNINAVRRLEFLGGQEARSVELAVIGDRVGPIEAPLPVQAAVRAEGEKIRSLEPPGPRIAT